MSHTELISFLRSLPDTGVILIFYRDASRAQTPISTPTGDAVDLSRSHPNLTFLKSNSSFGKTNKPLRFEAKEMVRSLQVRALNISTFFLVFLFILRPRALVRGGGRCPPPLFENLLDNTMASLRHIIMGRNGDYFLNYIDYSKNFDAVLKLLLVI